MKYLLATLFTLFSLSVFAQQNHFIYIQSDNQQAFYIKLDKKIMSSSASGYLIIPKLKEGSYDLAIGFPKDEWPEQNVTCTVKEADAGYLLKNFGEKGWGLFNFQTMDLVMAGEKPRTDSNLVAKKTDDPFANVLSTVVNNPAIKNTEEVKEEPVTVVKPATKKPVQKEPVKKAVKQAKTKAGNDMTRTRARIKKLHDNKGADSLNIVYVDMVKGKADTINVIIPSGNPVTTVMPAMPVTDSVPAPVKTDIAVDTVQTVNTNARQPANKEEMIVVDSAKNATVEVIPPLVDTTVTAVVEKKPARNEVANSKSRSGDKKTVKKPKQPKVETAKKEDRSLPVTVDTTVVVQPVMKEGIAKAGTKKTQKKNLKPATKVVQPVDTTVAVQPAIKEVIAKAGAKKTRKKMLKPVVEVVQPVDTTVLVQTEKKPGVIADTTIRTDIAVVIPAIDTAVIVKPVSVVPESKTVEPVVNEKPVHTDTVSKTPVAAVSKEPRKEVIITPEKPRETEVTNGNPYFPKMNTACKNFVDDDEYLGLRKKMDKSKTDDEKLYLAHKVFTKKCFSTRQIQRLSLLFTTDAGKYKLFDDAYQFTADLENFPSLESELKDDYYIKRFRVMIR